MKISFRFPGKSGEREDGRTSQWLEMMGTIGGVGSEQRQRPEINGALATPRD